ncbi:MAG: hypothetical protein F6K10_05450 [Moorea sp. SIO2B7]|nr:hypothetical protein [Moorena sp. SIO2B7]
MNMIIAILMEIIYRGLNHFSVARQQGLAHDPIQYFAGPENSEDFLLIGK